MYFPQIIKDLEQKKKNKTQGIVMVAITRDNETGEYTIYANNETKNDPFLKFVFSRILNYIRTTYEKE